MFRTARELCVETDDFLLSCWKVEDEARVDGHGGKGVSRRSAREHATPSVSVSKRIDPGHDTQRVQARNAIGE